MNLELEIVGQGHLQGGLGPALHMLFRVFVSDFGFFLNRAGGKMWTDRLISGDRLVLGPAVHGALASLSRTGISLVCLIAVRVAETLTVASSIATAVFAIFRAATVAIVASAFGISKNGNRLKNRLFGRAGAQDDLAAVHLAVSLWPCPSRRLQGHTISIFGTPNKGLCTVFNRT